MYSRNMSDTFIQGEIQGEPIVVKHRISLLVGTDLETLLRASGIDTLVLAGAHTSGVVLSTVRHAGALPGRSS
jgi:nicotinamidase-related amidase